MVCAVRKKGSLLPSHRFINAFKSHKNINWVYIFIFIFLSLIVFLCAHLRLCVHKLVYMHICVCKPTCVCACVSTRGYWKATSTAAPQKLWPCFLRQGLSRSMEHKWDVLHTGQQEPEICFFLSPSAGLQAEPPHQFLISAGSGSSTTSLTTSPDAFLATDLTRSSSNYTGSSSIANLRLLMDRSDHLQPWLVSV